MGIRRICDGIDTWAVPEISTRHKRLGVRTCDQSLKTHPTCPTAQNRIVGGGHGHFPIGHLGRRWAAGRSEMERGQCCSRHIVGTGRIPNTSTRGDLPHQIDAGSIVRPELDGDIRKGHGGSVVDNRE